LRWEASQRRKARRSTSPAADQVRAGHQSEDRECARPHRAANAAETGRRGHRMNRRDLLAVVAVAAATFAALAQQKKLPTIGSLTSNPPDVPVGEVAAFRDGLAEAGVIEGRDAAIEYHFAEGNYDSLPRFAAELASRDVDVIAASGLTGGARGKIGNRKDPDRLHRWCRSGRSGARREPR